MKKHLISKFPRHNALIAAAVTLATYGAICNAQPKKYPPQSQYLMAPDDEVALARSAAPASLSDRATVKILTVNGYQIAEKGDNGFVCMVMRGWANSGMYTPAEFRDLAYEPRIRAPICFTPDAARIIEPYYEMKDRLGISGKTPDEIANEVQAAYSTGKLPGRDMVTFAYMWSAHQFLNPISDHEGKDLSHGWHPHMMVYAPYYVNSMLGGSPLGSLPIVGDDVGTPFAVIYIPVDQKLLVEPRRK